MCMVLESCFYFSSICSHPSGVTFFADTPAIFPNVHSFLSKLMAFIAVRFPSVLSRRCITTHYVRDVVHQLNMDRVDASPHSAQVVAVHSIWYFTVKMFVHNPVRPELFLAIEHYSVSVAIYRSCVQPAILCVNHITIISHSTTTHNIVKVLRYFRIKATV